MRSIVALVSLSLMLCACAHPFEPAASPRPDATDTPTPIPLATATLPAAASTTPESSLGSKPVSEWQGIPILPGASLGGGDEDAYVFTAKATPQQVQEYYQVELGRLGWQLLGQEANDSSLTLTFAGPDSASLTINILAKGEEVLVLLAK